MRKNPLDALGKPVQEPSEPSEADDRLPLSERAYRLIRRSILRGDIAPGSRLKIETFRREYKFSSSPLRDALNRLAAEKLVENDERRGFRAAAVSIEDMRDLTAFRLNIETTSLLESIDLGGDDWEARIIAAFHRLERLESRESDQQIPFTDEWAERHKAFHMALISCCPSLRQRSLCSSLFDEAERYRRLSITSRKTKRDNAGEHRAIMKAALSRDRQQAAVTLRAHIEKTASHVAEVLAARTRPSKPAAVRRRSSAPVKSGESFEHDI
jgi:DNA-binding GntR family transcriptional regulator